MWNVENMWNVECGMSDDFTCCIFSGRFRQEDGVFIAILVAFLLQFLPVWLWGIPQLSGSVTKCIHFARGKSSFSIEESSFSIQRIFVFYIKASFFQGKNLHFPFENLRFLHLNAPFPNGNGLQVVAPDGLQNPTFSI